MVKLNWYVEKQVTWGEGKVWGLVLDTRGILLRVEDNHWTPSCYLEESSTLVTISDRSEPENLEPKKLLITVPLEFVYTQGTLGTRKD